MKKIDTTPFLEKLRILIVEGGEGSYFICFGDEEADKKAKELAIENKGTSKEPPKCVHVCKPIRLFVEDESK